jgi:acetyl esterase/lipase
MATTSPSTDAHPRFAPFLRLRDIPYSTFRSEPLSMDIWIPRNLTANSHPPVLVNWHGGGLISGVRDNGEWWQQYILDLAVQHNALMLAPDYPLAPEAQTPDILASIERFLAWLLDDGGLQTALDQHAVSAPLRITADTTKLLVMGSSSGGWC